MADQQIEELGAITSLADGDQFLVNDVSDTTDDVGGSPKKITASNVRGYMLYNPNWITGCVPTWVSATSISWTNGTAMVEGTLLTLSSLSKSLTTSDDGLSAEGVWLHWLWDNGGADILFTQDDSSNAPTWDTTYGYWSKNGDPTYRLIGWHLVDTDTTRKIMDFIASQVGWNTLHTVVQAASSSQNRFTINDASTTVSTPTAMTYVDRATPENSMLPSVANELDILIKYKLEDLENTTNLFSAEFEIHPENRLPIAAASAQQYAANLCRLIMQGANIENGYFFLPRTIVNVKPLTTSIYYTLLIVSGAGTIVDFLIEFIGARFLR